MSIDPTAPAIVYPESDGKPMADNTLQWEWMVRIVGELREQYAGQQVFVAGDLFWYPVEGDPRTVVAPDGLVAFGRAPGYRGSYKQWEEGNVAPQVVFEVMSPNNTVPEMDAKLDFYERHGVEEYYYIDPYENEMEAYVRRGNRLRSVRWDKGFVSPRLGIRFEKRGEELVVIGPDGRVFQDREERVQEIQEELRKTAMAFEEEHARAIEESNRADAEAERANTEAERANLEAERAKAEAKAKELLAAKLRELGVSPDDVLRSAG
jgi:hypothetical protein